MGGFYRKENEKRNGESEKQGNGETGKRREMTEGRKEELKRGGKTGGLRDLGTQME
jgi:hypothetical protein